MACVWPAFGLLTSIDDGRGLRLSINIRLNILCRMDILCFIKQLTLPRMGFAVCAKTLMLSKAELLL
jgi:hypothetical protein